MPRNAEVIRQWSILRDLESSRRLTIDELAARTGVSTRTIRRDLEALQASGFPLYDDTHDGKRYWMLEQRPFRRLDETGFTLAELSALYFSRTLVESLSATVFRDDVESAFEKLSSGLTPHMRQFLDQLPRVIAAKPDSLGRPISANSATQVPRQQQQLIGRALDAILNYRQAAITYYSKSSERQKDYLVHPYRLAHAQGALYLLAYVPEYVQVRTFAVERIRSLTVLDERFTPIEELPDVAFPHSLGVHSGPPERVEIAFQPTVADYIRSREWHPSQHLQECDAGGVVMSLDVCIDRALRSWILSFGPLARIVSPESLADDIAGQLETARAQYHSVHAGP